MALNDTVKMAAQDASATDVGPERRRSVAPTRRRLVAQVLEQAPRRDRQTLGSTMLVTRATPFTSHHHYNNYSRGEWDGSTAPTVAQQRHRQRNVGTSPHLRQILMVGDSLFFLDLWPPLMVCVRVDTARAVAACAPFPPFSTYCALLPIQETTIVDALLRV